MPRLRPVGLILSILTLALPLAAGAGSPPAMPSSGPVLLPGDARLELDHVSPYEVSSALGRADQTQPLAQAGAWQQAELQRVSTDDGEVLRRIHRVRRADSDAVLAEASIDLDARTLLPLEAVMKRGGQETRIEYDWADHVVRKFPGTDGAEHDEFSLDLGMFEVGAHELWVAALPLREGFSARLPAVFAATGTKYWAVPRVVGTESIEFGGATHSTWVVEMDWWGMGAANTEENYSTGGDGGFAGAGGKYWVLKKPVDGLPRVVRIRTAIGEGNDSIVEVRSD